MLWNTLNGSPPRIIAHRGASGHRPEHTLEAYALAIAQGADALEPDLVPSRDGVLFARHDIGLGRSTDIATRAEFSARARVIDGVRDWWICDFDAHEIDALRATQPIAGRSAQFDRQFGVPRFSQLLDFVMRENARREIPLVIDAEIKDPAFFHQRGIDMLVALTADLEAHGMTGPQAPVWLETFDHAFLRDAFERCGNPCFALLNQSPHGVALRELARWVCGIAPAKHLLWDGDGRDSGLVGAAHSRGLEVHAWTFREDYSPTPFASTAKEIHAAFALGVDALFCDFPDVAVSARANYGVSEPLSENRRAVVAPRA
jgi:glycerophosphoryl diester phosphodiesterase